MGTCFGMVIVSGILLASFIVPKLVLMSVNITLVQGNFFTPLNCQYLSQSQYHIPLTCGGGMARYVCVTLCHFELSLCVTITSFLHHARMRWWYGKDTHCEVLFVNWVVRSCPVFVTIHCH